MKFKYLLAFSILYFIVSSIPALAKNEPQTFWKYQCIDTMKSSRDTARRWKDDPKLTQYIDKELTAIAEMGANCVAIDTPYNDEFLPFLRLWVKESRKKNLKIWYRGNFAEWEGWFNYPKGMSADELIKRSNEFIRKNKDLFEDGDIYTAAPEAENGGPFNQVEKDEHEAYRAFLIRVHDETKKAFEEINRDVVVNWLSMNGGLAKRMFDQPTLNALGKIAGLDHYIKTAPEMGEFIRYFRDTFGAKVIIGEFGAPVPEINGPMTDQEQAEFIDALFDELYRYKDSVEGINYWVTYDSSTAVLNPDYSPRPAVAVIKKYFKPGIVKGIVRDNHGIGLQNVTVRAGDGVGKAVTNRKGEYRLLLPAKPVTISYRLKDYKSQSTIITIRSDEEINSDAVLQPLQVTTGFWYVVQTFFRRLLHL